MPFQNLSLDTTIVNGDYGMYVMYGIIFLMLYFWWRTLYG